MILFQKTAFQLNELEKAHLLFKSTNINNDIKS